MKKVLATILAVIYLATSSAAVITMHYCMGKMYAIDLGKKDKCSKCGMKNAKGCCDDKVKVIKVQDAHQLGSQTVLFQPFLAFLYNEYNVFNTLSQINIRTFTANNNSPPGANKVPLYITHCKYCI